MSELYLADDHELWLNKKDKEPTFYGWDCDSICVFNPNAIEQIEESEDDYNKIRDAYDYESAYERLNKE